MKTKSVLFLLFVLLSLVACKPKPTADNNQVLIDSLISNLCNAMSGGDIEKLMSFYTDDILVMSVGANYPCKDSLKAHMAPLMPFYKNVTFHKGLSTINDNIITYHGLFSLDWSMEAVPQPVRGVGTLVWQKQSDGQWKVIVEKLDFGIVIKK